MGLLIQFVFGLVVLRWTAGLKAFEWAGNKVTTFLSYTDIGTAFVFGENLLGTGTTQFFHEMAFVVGSHRHYTEHLRHRFVMHKNTHAIVDINAKHGVINSLGPSDAI